MNIKNRDSFFTTGAHTIKKIKMFCSCCRFKAISQLISTIEIVSAVVTIEQQNIFRGDLFSLFNNLNIFLITSNSFSRVQKKYFLELKFEFGKMIEFFRVRSPVSYITAQQQTHITAQQKKSLV